MNSKLLGKFAEASSAKIEITSDFGAATGPVTNSAIKDPVVVMADPAAGLPRKSR